MSCGAAELAAGQPRTELLTEEWSGLAPGVYPWGGTEQHGKGFGGGLAKLE